MQVKANFSTSLSIACCMKLALFLCSAVLFADPLNVEMLAHLRTRQYPKHPYDKIIIFSPPRTGSSLTYNFFRFLFEDEQCLSFFHNEFRLDRSVLKTHKIPEIETMIKNGENTLYVVTIRDPLQSSISTYRIRSEPIRDMQKFCENIVRRHVKYFTFIEQMKKAGLPVTIVRYEDIEKGQCDTLLDFIEAHFHLSISEQDIYTLKAGYSRENIYYNIRSLLSFKEALPISGFHGNHVTREGFIPPEQLLFWLKHYFNSVKPLFKKYGYTICEK